MEACYGGTDVMERSCAVARGIDININTDKSARGRAPQIRVKLKTRCTPLILLPRCLARQRLACRTFTCVVSPLIRTGNDQDPKKERATCPW
jgi:hypothetical protein